LWSANIGSRLNSGTSTNSRNSPCSAADCTARSSTCASTRLPSGTIAASNPEGSNATAGGAAVTPLFTWKNRQYS
jgi:hypothetical protein